MTASERAALEALTDCLEALDDLAADSAGVAGLHLNGELATWDWLFENEWLQAFVRARSLLSSPPPASDERPSEEHDTRIRCDGSPDGEARCTRFTHATGEHRHDDEAAALWNGMTYWYRVAQDLRAAAAPAPDEGRTDEKKLTRAASAPQRQSPTKGSDAGCDGEGSRRWCCDYCLHEAAEIPARECPKCGAPVRAVPGYPRAPLADGDRR